MPGKPPIRPIVVPVLGLSLNGLGPQKEAKEPEPTSKNPITLFLHCRACLDAGRKDRLAVGPDPAGVIVVWCETCDRQVARLTPETIAKARQSGCAVCNTPREQALASGHAEGCTQEKRTTATERSIAIEALEKIAIVGESARHFESHHVRTARAIARTTLTELGIWRG